MMNSTELTIIRDQACENRACVGIKYTPPHYRSELRSEPKYFHSVTCVA